MMMQQQEIHAAIPAQEELLLALSVVRDLAIDQGTAIRGLAEATAALASQISGRSGYKHNALGDAQIQVMCLLHASESFEALAESQMLLSGSMAKVFEPANKLLSKYFNDLATSEKALSRRIESAHQRLERLREEKYDATDETRHHIYRLTQQHLEASSDRLREIDLHLTRGSVDAVTRLFTNMSNAMASAGARNGLAGLEKWGVFLESQQAPLPKPDAHRSLSVIQGRQQAQAFRQFVREQRLAVQNMPITRWRSSIVGHLDRIASDDSFERDIICHRSTVDVVVQPGPTPLAAQIEVVPDGLRSNSALIKHVDVDTVKSRRGKHKTLPARPSDVTTGTEEDEWVDDSRTSLPIPMAIAISDESDWIQGPVYAEVVNVPPKPKRSTSSKRRSVVNPRHSVRGVALGESPPLPDLPPSAHPPPLVPPPVFEHSALSRYASYVEPLPEFESQRASLPKSLAPVPASTEGRSAKVASRDLSTASKSQQRMSKVSPGMKFWRMFTKSGRLKNDKERRVSLLTRRHATAQAEQLQQSEQRLQKTPPPRPPRSPGLSLPEELLRTSQSIHNPRNTNISAQVHDPRPSQQPKPRSAQAQASRRISIFAPRSRRPASTEMTHEMTDLQTFLDEDAGTTQRAVQHRIKKQDASLRPVASSHGKQPNNESRNEIANLEEGAQSEKKSVDVDKGSRHAKRAASERQNKRDAILMPEAVGQAMVPDVTRQSLPMDKANVEEPVLSTTSKLAEPELHESSEPVTVTSTNTQAHGGLATAVTAAAADEGVTDDKTMSANLAIAAPDMPLAESLENSALAADLSTCEPDETDTQTAGTTTINETTTASAPATAGVNTKPVSTEERKDAIPAAAPELEDTTLSS